MKAVVSAERAGEGADDIQGGAGRAGGKAGNQHPVGRDVEPQPHLVELPRRVELVGAGEDRAQRVGAEHLAVAQHRKAAAVLGFAVV